MSAERRALAKLLRACRDVRLWATAGEQGPHLLAARERAVARLDQAIAEAGQIIPPIEEAFVEPPLVLITHKPARVFQKRRFR
jgi:hypothetical protein